MKNFQGRGLNLRGKKRAGVELAMKNWEGKKLHLPTIPVCPPPHLLGAHALFALQLRPCMLLP